jgi:prevent-host-death family protein
MKTTTIHRAKTNLSQLIEAACAGEDVVIARGNMPVVRLVPIAEASGKRRPGVLKGKLRVEAEFFQPLPAEDLEGWE